MARRVLPLAALSLVAGLALWAAPGGGAPPLPDLRLERLVVDPSDPALRFDPNDEFDFPSVIRVGDVLDDALATYYLYYAPHDAPGGIALAYADSLEGPWTEHPANPVIGPRWPGTFEVSHVSSPHALWQADEGRLFLYFHGENDSTRLATSRDGISFEGGEVVVSSGDVPGATEASYARVFEHRLTGSRDRYVMLLMIAGADDRRRIHLATSRDGRAWTVRPRPLVSPGDDEGDNLSGPWYLPWHGRHVVVYHASSGTMHMTEVGADFDQERHLGVFFRDPGMRAAAPAFITEGDRLAMLYERGPRHGAAIALAWAVEPTLASAVRTVDTATGGVAGDVDRSDGWAVADDSIQRYGATYLTTEGDGAWLTFQPRIEADGPHLVEAWWPTVGGGSRTVAVDIGHVDGRTSMIIDQARHGGRWNLLGTHGFRAGEHATIRLGPADADSAVVADAVRLTPVGP